jgi:hypothetical protein
MHRFYEANAAGEHQDHEQEPEEWKEHDGLDVSPRRVSALACKSKSAFHPKLALAGLAQSDLSHHDSDRSIDRYTAGSLKRNNRVIYKQ